MNARVRTALLPAVLAAAAFTPATAAAYFDTHLNEIAAPAADAARAEIARLSALPAPTKADRKTLAALRALDRKLSKTATRLSQDFAELSAAAAAFAKLGTAFDAATDAGIARAHIALQERDDSILDRRALLSSGAERSKVDVARSKAATIRAAALAAADRDDRARYLAKAEKAYTSALALAEKYAKRTGQTLPAVRLRSGDQAGPGGARIAVPVGTGTSIDGASVLVPAGALAGLEVVTLTEAASFIGGRDVPAGPAVAIDANGAVFGAPVVVSLPYTLPSGARVTDIAVFRDESPDVALAGTTVGLDGRAAASTSTLGTFQAGVQAPPLGSPEGSYTLFMFAVVTATGTTTSAPVAFDPGLTAGVVVQEVQFRRDGTGAASTGSFPLVGRAFQRTSPHHADSSATGLAGSFDFAWTRGAQGRFSFALPLQSGLVADAYGVASADGAVISFAGHGAGFDFFAIGVRSGVTATAAQLEGRWTGVETGVRLLGDAGTPFRTQWTAATRDFAADAAGGLTFSGGTAFRSTTTYRTDLSDPIHAVAVSSDADSATESVIVSADGRISDAQGRLRGLFAPSSGILVIARIDAATKDAALMVAARQDATVAQGAFEGTWNLTRSDGTFGDGTPDARSSTHGLRGSAGSLVVTANGDATETIEPSLRGIYTLSGITPVSSMTWTMSHTAQGSVIATRDFALSLDAGGGNHRGATPVWYSVSNDGSVVLGTVTGTTVGAPLGIVLGLR